MTKFICLFCNKIKIRPKYSEDKHHSTHKEWANRKFCNTECRANYWKLNGSPRNTRITLVCKKCMSEYKVGKSREHISKFCSKKCQYSFYNYGKTTENEAIRKSTKYKIWRKAVFERDDYTCQMCNVRGGVLHADHIKQFAFFPNLRLDINNGRTLCIDCHKSTDTFGRTSIFGNVVSVSREA